MLTLGSAHRLEIPHSLVYTFYKAKTLYSLFFPRSHWVSNQVLPKCLHQTAPQHCWLLAQSTLPPPPPLRKVVWPPTCICWAWCYPLLMINLLLVGFIPILYNYSICLRYEFCKEEDANHRQELVLKWPFHLVYHTFNSYRHQLALHWLIFHLILVLLVVFNTNTFFLIYLWPNLLLTILFSFPSLIFFASLIFI